MSGAADEVYASIRAAILDGSMAPGSRLGEVDLASQFDTSRTPVREALRRLDADGFVHIELNKGARVTEWSIADLEEIYELRALLESHAAGRAATRMTTPNIERLDELCEQMEALTDRQNSVDYEQIAILNSQLHQIILEAAESARLISMMGSVVHVPLILKTFHGYTPEYLARSMGAHRELVAAIRARNADWAQSAMCTHLLAAKSVLVQGEGLLHR